MIGVRTLRKFSVLLVALFALAGAAAAQQPPPVSFLPGFPMVAGSMVMVMWMPVPGAKEYKLYRNDTVLATTQATTHMDPLESLSGELRYQVAAVGLDGAEGPKGAAGVVKIIKLEAPGNVAVMEVGAEVRVRWDAAAGAMVYNVYKADKAEGPFAMLASVTGTNYPDPALKPGEAAAYRVTAKDQTGKESVPSAAVSFTRPAAKAAAEEGRDVMYKRTETLLRIYDSLRDVNDKPVPLRAPMDLAVSPDGALLYVATGGGNHVARFRVLPDPKGKWGFALEGFYGPNGFSEDEGAAGRAVQMRAMTLDAQGATLAFLDAIGDQVYVVDAVTGKVTSTFAFTPDKLVDKKPVRPTCIRFDPDGNLWMSDAMNENFKVYDTRGALLETKGGPEVIQGVGYFALDLKNKRLAATNTGTRSVSLVDADGKLLKHFGEVGVGGGKIWAPTGIDLLPEGVIVQADGINSIVNFFDLEGKLLYHLRNVDDDIFQTASTRGFLVRKNMIYVTQATNDEVRILRIQDELLKESEARKKP